MCDKERIVSYIYDELDRAGRAEMEAHLKMCAHCREEVTALRNVRVDLGKWTPPQPEFGFHIVRDRKPTWRAWWTPAFGLAAAAVLILAIASAIANVDVSYGADGFHVRAGRGRVVETTAATTKPEQGQAVAAPTSTPNGTPAADEMQVLLASLERRVHQLESAPRTSAVQQAAMKATRQSDEEMLRRVGDLLAQSESKQRQELALRIAQVIRDVDAQRIADLNRIQQGFVRIDSMTTAEAAAHRELANYIVASSRQQK